MLRAEPKEGVMAEGAYNDAKKKQLPALDLEGGIHPERAGGGLIVDAKRECDPTDSV